MQKYFFLLIFTVLVSSLSAQRDFYQKKFSFSEADTLRGMLTPERSCYDVTFYDLYFTVHIQDQSLRGGVNFHFNAVDDFKRLQFDLFENMEIEGVYYQKELVPFERKHNAVFVNFEKEFIKGEKGMFTVLYKGKPIAARNAPWDGGFVWKKDENGNPWIGVACEGTGASLWWPNKDHLSDEPDSMKITVSLHKNLTVASNGQLRKKYQDPIRYDINVWEWFVSYPINNYNVSITIGDFANFKDYWVSSDGDSLELDYYVLKDNLAKAKTQFEQVHQMLDCYEHYFSKYPFWNDGFSLIETPYLGMEHQSGIAYGNGYQRGYRGGMIPKDMDWDYIIIHETGHEWFGNSVSSNDHMPILVGQKGNYQSISPSGEWQTTTLKKIKPNDFQIAKELFLVRLADYSDL